MSGPIRLLGPRLDKVGKGSLVTFRCIGREAGIIKWIIKGRDEHPPLFGYH